jgi:hypothetical protein
MKHELSIVQFSAAFVSGTLRTNSCIQMKEKRVVNASICHRKRARREAVRVGHQQFPTDGPSIR